MDYNNICDLKIMCQPGAKLPARAKPGDAGFDLFTYRVVESHRCITVYTGVHLQLPEGWYAMLHARSSTPKLGIFMRNSVGIIDNYYIGEIIANFSPFIIDNYKLPEIGSRVLQLTFHRLPDVSMTQVEQLDPTERGDGGFGSSGK